MEILTDVWGRVWSPPDRRPIWEWATDQVQMPRVLTLQGKFQAHVSRHFMGPMEALLDDHVRQVVIRKPVRGGGTLIGDLWQCWTRANDAGPQMDIFQSDKIGEDHFEDRLKPMLLSCSTISHLLPPDSRQIQRREIKYSDGLPHYISGPGINNLQTKGVRYMRLDEPWLYKPGTIEEAEGRLGDYLKMQTSKLLLISQAGEEDDDFDRRFTSGSCSMWNVSCRSCGLYFAPRWTFEVRVNGETYKRGMRWDEYRDERGHWDVEKCLASVRYECPKCGGEHRDTPSVKGEWNNSGRYEATNFQAPRSRASFHWNALVDYPWASLVEMYLKAVNAYKLGSPDALVIFFQKYMAEPRSLRTLGVGTMEFTRKTFAVEGWKEEHMRVMTVDRQADHYWVLVCAWSAAGECRRLWFGRLYTRADLKSKADEWKCLNVLNDCGYEARGPNGVYATCALYHCEAQTWIAVKGVKEKSFKRHVSPQRIVESSYTDPMMAEPNLGMSNAGSMEAITFSFSADRIADITQGMIHRGRWVEPQGVNAEDEMEREYGLQMGSEYKRKRVNPKTGRPEWEWVQARADNHAWDCAKMQTLAAIMAQVVPDIGDAEEKEE